MAAAFGPSSSTGVVVRRVSKRFGSVDALREVDFSVAPEELVVILGENGAGKSTLLRILGTTVLPDSGTATIAGRDVLSDPAGCRRAAGVVLGDERSWYWRLTGRANLEFFAALYGIGRQRAKARAEELLSLVGLEGLAERRFDGYSSGMRARLSIARALLADPPVLLLDEPSRTLDPLAAADVRRILAGLARDRGKAVLWVSHDIAEAVEIADRVLIMIKGKLASSTTPGSAADLADLFTHVARQAGQGAGEGVAR